MCLSIKNFPRALRLRTKKDFQAVFAKASRIGGQSFTLITAPNSFLHSRLGMSVAKKNIKHAVVRNRVKRLIRESFRGIRSQLGSIDIVVIVQRSAGQATNQQLYKQLEKQWQKLITSYQKS